MISILIPVYNFNIVPLVSELHRQASLTSVPFEIIVLDDCSSSLLRGQNKDVSKLDRVKFHELNTNVGRASIRNRLAGMAEYSSLLFMDCDSEIPGSKYIENYLPFCSQDVVVCGGRIYRPDPPDEPEMMLRWLYGVHREQIPVAERQEDPYHSFMTNNFLISRSILSRIHFDESIVQYGHEDTLFGFELRKGDIPVIHIDNPLLHIGLEIAREFLRKTSEGIENLVTLVQEGKINRDDFRDIRLLRTYDTLDRFRMVSIYLLLFYLLERVVMRNLLGSNPNLRAFDLYKLSVLARQIRKNKFPISLFERS